MKMQRLFVLRLGFVACAAAALPMTAGSAAAAGARGGDIVVVDINELQKGYAAYRDDVNAFQTFQEQRAKMFDARQFLTGPEWDELDLIEGKEKEKKKLTPQEEKRLMELRGMTELRKKAIRELQANPNMTDKDKEELKRLNDIPRTNQVRLEELNEKLVQEIEKERARLSERLRKALTEVYDKLAKERGFNIVLDRAQVQWSGPAVDITQDVLKALNKK